MVALLLVHVGNKEYCIVHIVHAVQSQGMTLRKSNPAFAILLLYSLFKCLRYGPHW